MTFYPMAGDWISKTGTLMKIVHSIKTLDFSDGGPVRAIIDLSTKLAERGHEVTIITLDDCDAPAEWRSNPKSNPRTIELGPMAMKGTCLSAAQKAKVNAALDEADLVHVHAIWEPLTLRVAAIARKRKLPYTISLRGMLDDWCMDQRRFKKLIYLRVGGTKMLNSAVAIHCTADGEREQSQKWFPKAPGIVIPNLLNLEPFETMPGAELARSKFPMFDTGDPVLLYLSRLHYKKGVEHLIEAIKILKDSGNPHRLLVVGDGDKEYENSLKDLVSNLELSEYVFFPGLVVGDEKVSLYQAADLFVLPTSQENFGFVLYESLAAGTTLVTTKGVDTWPELQEYAKATICKQEAQSFADTIAKLTSDKENLESLGKKGRAWIFDQMHPDKIITRFEALYDQVAKG